jgi:membrane protease subunit HflK
VALMAGTSRRIPWRLLAMLLVAGYLLSGVFFVGTDQQGLVFVLGTVRERPYEPGLHWTWPRPIARVATLKVRETKRLAVGYRMPEQVLERQPPPSQTQFLTGDRNLIDIRVVVQYVIRNPVSYLLRARDVQVVIASAVDSALTAVVVERPVDDVLTTGKFAVQNDVQTRAQEMLERYRCGVSVLGVNIETIAPPSEVVEAFRDVASAREDRDRIVREAQSYANERIALARGEAARLQAEAEAYRSRTVARAEGESARFTSVAREYRLAPSSTATRLYLETLEEVLPRLDINLVDPGSGPVEIDLLRRDGPGTAPR